MEILFASNLVWVVYLLARPELDYQHFLFDLPQRLSGLYQFYRNGYLAIESEIFMRTKERS